MTDRDNLDIELGTSDPEAAKLADQQQLASEEQLDDATARITSADITDTEFGEDPDIEVPCIGE